jgi:hypothetical protein
MFAMTTSADREPRAAAASASVTHGVPLTFETLCHGRALLRLRPLEDTLLRVIAGVVALSVDGDERTLGAGDEAIIPAATAHRLCAVAGEARFVSGFRRR